MSDVPKQNQGQGLVDRKYLESIAGRPKTAFLFGFFLANLCVVFVLSVTDTLLVMLRLGQSPPILEIADYVAVASDICSGF